MKSLLRSHRENTSDRSQSYIAGKMGVSVQAISKWEADLGKIPEGRLEAIRKVYELNELQYKELCKTRINLMSGPHRASSGIASFFNGLAEAIGTTQIGNDAIIMSLSAQTFQTTEDDELLRAVEACAINGANIVYIALPKATSQPAVPSDSTKVIDGLREHIKHRHMMREITNPSGGSEIPLDRFWGVSIYQEAELWPWRIMAALAKYLFVIIPKEKNGVSASKGNINDPLPDHFTVHDAWINYNLDSEGGTSIWRRLEITEHVTYELFHFIKHIKTEKGCETQNFA